MVSSSVCANKSHIFIFQVFKELQRVYDQNSNYQNIGFGEYRFKFEDSPEETTDELEQY